MKKLSLILIQFVFLPGCFMSSTRPEKHESLSQVIDLKKYSGKWYQVYETKQRERGLFEFFENVTQSCVGITVEYFLNEKGSISLKNSCFEGNSQGRKIEITGEAIAINKENNTLKVKFDPWYLPFSYDYWILYVDEVYSVALLASPESDGVTILSRTPELSNDKIQTLFIKARELNFNP